MYLSLARVVCQSSQPQPPSDNPSSRKSGFCDRYDGFFPPSYCVHAGSSQIIVIWRMILPDRRIQLRIRNSNLIINNNSKSSDLIANFSARDYKPNIVTSTFGASANLHIANPHDLVCNQLYHSRLIIQFFHFHHMNYDWNFYYYETNVKGISHSQTVSDQLYTELWHEQPFSYLSLPVFMGNKETYKRIKNIIRFNSFVFLCSLKSLISIPNSTNDLPAWLMELFGWNDWKEQGKELLTTSQKMYNTRETY